MKQQLEQHAREYLETLCETISNRATGSPGNREATAFFEKQLSSFGWHTEMPEFSVMDWKEDGASLAIDDDNFEVFASPYSTGCSVKARLTTASTIEELEQLNAKNSILLLHGEIAKEQLMPKNFVFYNPEEHQKIISLLEKSGASAIITATGRNSALAGGAYPFPLIEDGDFNIPSVYMTEEEGARLPAHAGKQAALVSQSERVPGKAYNVIAQKGKTGSQKITVTAHIDAKKGTPGAIDNATGVIVLLLLAELLAEYSGDTLIEIVAFNGEDYFAVSGQMDYIAANENNFENILLNINIDGAGYKEGPTAFSFFGLPAKIENTIKGIMEKHNDIVEGPQWAQGDHSIFVQYGRPAIAVSSLWFIEHMETQDITHTPKDHPRIVNCAKLVTIAHALAGFIQEDL
ncbi:MAG: M28 family peptidase [bacterium]|nr:M28 family peptidase [bacterium]